MKRWFRILRRQIKRGWFTEISDYLDIPQEEVIRSLGKLTGYQKEDKLKFSEKYDQGNRIITTINRNAEMRGELSSAWADLKYVAIRQEWAAFQRLEQMRGLIIPLIRKYVPSERGSILDYGCGTSLLGRLLLKEQPKYALTLCDVDGYHLRFALSECRKLAPHTEYSIVRGDNFVPEFMKKFDFIYCWAALEHIPNVLNVLKALHKALSEDGCLLETFGGETGKKPDSDSADSEKAWEQRDECFRNLMDTHQLVFGKVPEEVSGHFVKSQDFRIWKNKTSIK